MCSRSSLFLHYQTLKTLTCTVILASTHHRPLLRRKTWGAVFSLWRPALPSRPHRPLRLRWSPHFCRTESILSWMFCREKPFSVEPALGLEQPLRWSFRSLKKMLFKMTKIVSMIRNIFVNVVSGLGYYSMLNTSIWLFLFSEENNGHASKVTLTSPSFVVTGSGVLPSSPWPPLRLISDEIFRTGLKRRIKSFTDCLAM